MRKVLLILALISLPLSPLSTGSNPQVWIWNVGQGQWVTLSVLNYCIHIDMGGEKAPWHQIKKTCWHSKNVIFFTHFDFDHRNFLDEFLIYFSSSANCIALHNSQMQRAKDLSDFSNIPPCRNLSFFRSFLQFLEPLSPFSLSENEKSLWYVLFNHVLITGDSPSKREKMMIPFLKNYEQIEHWILGHHGSRFSNSSESILALRSLRAGWVSARKQKYGHPHTLTLQRFQKRELPVFSTQKKGSLNIGIPLIKMFSIP